MRSPVIVADWIPIGFNVSTTAHRLCLLPYQTCTGRSFVGRISVPRGIPRWDNAVITLLDFGSGQTELVLRDYIYFESPGYFSYWVSLMPVSVDLPEADADPWSSTMGFGSAEVGDL